MDLSGRRAQGHPLLMVVAWSACTSWFLTPLLADTGTCGTDQLKCDNGTCISKSFICDGVSNCQDGSDESQSLCSSKSRSSQPFCTYPPIPMNGQYQVYGCESCVPVPGERPEQQLTVLNYRCDSGYKIKGEEVVYCTSRGQWSVDFPACVPVTESCQPLLLDSVDAVCSLKRKEVPCNKTVLPGTRAVLQCKNYFMPAFGTNHQSIWCGSDGEWTGAVMKCKPACGRDRSEGSITAFFGKVAEYGDFPWHVGVYRDEKNDYTQICAGSLISTKYIISAAHCFWSTQNRALNSEKDFVMVAGKLHRTFDTEDPGQQVRKVQKIDIPDYFTGAATLYRDDIAVITVTEPFIISYAVQPVCVDWDNTYPLVQDSIGKFAGWGNTEEIIVSEDLLYKALKTVSYAECVRSAHPEYQQYFSKDTICAVETNGTYASRGDTGGSLCFPYETVSEGLQRKLYFIQGILSTGARKNSDDHIKSFALTRVSNYLNFLSKYRE